MTYEDEFEQKERRNSIQFRCKERFIERLKHFAGDLGLSTLCRSWLYERLLEEERKAGSITLTCSNCNNMQRKGGLAKTEKKQAAARLNGLKGGRPKKDKQDG